MLVDRIATRIGPKKKNKAFLVFCLHVAKSLPFHQASGWLTMSEHLPLPVRINADMGFASSADFEHVYEPAEDTWLLMDALSADAAALLDLHPRVCCEIGCGSGAVITTLGLILGAHAASYVATDLNPHALRLAQRTGRHNKIPLSLIQTHLLEGLLPRLNRSVDVLLFNPPYVPTPSSEVSGNGIERSWAGGARGREVLDLVLPLVSQILSPHGCFYLITVDDNDPDEICATLARDGFAHTVRHRCLTFGEGSYC